MPAQSSVHITGDLQTLGAQGGGLALVESAHACASRGVQPWQLSGRHALAVSMRRHGRQGWHARAAGESAHVCTCVVCTACVCRNGPSPDSQEGGPAPLRGHPGPLVGGPAGCRGEAP